MSTIYRTSLSRLRWQRFREIMRRITVLLFAFGAIALAVSLSRAHASPCDKYCGLRQEAHSTYHVRHHVRYMRHFRRHYRRRIARHRIHHRRHQVRRARAHLDANGNVARGLVTVSTAAGIRITVSRSIEHRMLGFIRDVVARGYHPDKIHCYSWAKGHVRHSLHHSGNACDFDQRGWGLTARAMYHVADLARKWGLRDGCTFRDCGHIDSGFSRVYSARRHWRHRRVAGR